MSPSSRNLFTLYVSRNNLQDLLQSRKKLNVVVLTVLFLVEKIKRHKAIFKICESAFFQRMKNLYTKKRSTGSNFDWLIRQMSIDQKSWRKTFHRRFVPGSLFNSPCSPECYLQSETKIEPDLRLLKISKY